MEVERPPKDASPRRQSPQGFSDRRDSPRQDSPSDDGNEKAVSEVGQESDGQREEEKEEKEKEKESTPPAEMKQTGEAKEKVAELEAEDDGMGEVILFPPVQRNKSRSVPQCPVSVLSEQG